MSGIEMVSHMGILWLQSIISRNILSKTDVPVVYKNPIENTFKYIALIIWFWSKFQEQAYNPFMPD